MQSGEQLFVAAKYLGGTRDEIDAFLNWLWHYAVGLAVEQQWPYPKNLRGRELYRYLSRCAAARHIPAEKWSTCVACNGPGSACGHCRGRGTLLLQPAELAALIEMKPADFDAKWGPRIDAIEAPLTIWDKNFLSHAEEQTHG